MRKHCHQDPGYVSKLANYYCRSGHFPIFVAMVGLNQSKLNAQKSLIKIPSALYTLVHDVHIARLDHLAHFSR